MVGQILKEAVVLIVFCHIFVSGKDLLENYQPNPSLPHELNEWLASVQKHKNDFRLIRDVVAKKRKIRLDDDDDELSEKKHYSHLHLEDDDEDQKSDASEDEPENDIYPYIYKSRRNLADNSRKLNTKKRYLRRKRASDKDIFDEHKDFVNLEPNSKIGEIKRAEEKYPERYKERFSEDSKMKSNFKERKDASDADKDVSKRDVQIDIRKDGKLLKQIREDEKNPKSVILNIQPSEDTVRSTDVPGLMINPAHVPEPNSYGNAQQASKFPPERSINFNSNQMKVKEFYSNFNNLFSANEHLNTDSSLAREGVSAVGPLVYHVTIPDINTYQSTSSYTHISPQSRTENAEKKERVFLSAFPYLMGDNDNIKSTSKPYSYNQNNLQDMSKFWTPLEKHQMQKGIAFARNNENLRKLVPQLKSQQKVHAQNETEVGFEPAQRIEEDNGKLVKISVEEKLNSERGLESNIDKHLTRNNIVGLNNNREGIIEIGNHSPNLDTPDIKDMASVDKNLDIMEISNAEPFGKGSYKSNTNNLEPSSKIDIIETYNDKPVYITDPHKPYNTLENNKDTIPSYEEFSKIKNKRQLRFLQGKLEVINNDDVDSSDNVHKPKSVKRHGRFRDSSQNFEGEMMMLKAKNNDQNLEIEPFDHLTSTFASLSLDSLVDSVSEPNIGNGVPDTGNKDQNFELDQEIQESPDTGNGNQPKEIENPNEESVIEESENSLNENYEKDDVPQDNKLHSKEIKDKGFEGHQANNRHIRKFHPHIEHENSIMETESEAGPSAEDVSGPHENSLRNLKETPQNEVRGLTRLLHIRNSNIRPRVEGFNDKRNINNRKKHLLKKHAKIYTERFDPNLKKLVIVYNNLPYSSERRKNARYRHLNNIAENNVGNSIDESLDQSAWAMDNDESNYRNQIVHQLPPNLIIRKRANSNDNQALTRKKYRKRQMYSEADSDASSDFANEYIGRRLKTVEYVYDDYDKSDDYYGDVSTEVQEVATEGENRVELLQKDSVEGDYGDEEDSVTEKQKKAEFNIVKKTNNEFANPPLTTESEDDYYNDDYGNNNSGNEKSEEKENPVTEESSAENSNPDINSVMPEVKGHGISSVHAHGRSNANKNKAKIIRKHTPLKENKIKFENHKNVAAIHKPARKVSRNRRNRNRRPNKAYLGKSSDFQHWPTFVMNDNENEEKLGKRSLVFKKKHPRSYSFPLASNDFFIKPKIKRKATEPKREKSTEKVVSEAVTPSEVEMPLDMEKRESASPMPLESQITRDASSSSTDEICSTNHVRLSNACEMDENFNRTRVEVTTILSMDSPHEGNDNDTGHGVYEKLDDVLDGYFPSRLVSDIFDAVKENDRLKSRFNKGMRRSYKNLNLQNLNDTNTEETRRILNSMTCLMNRLQLTATCQILPHNLRNYLKTITKIKKEDSLARMKEMEEINLDDNQNQKNFVFESVPQGVSTYNDKAQIMEDLLSKFNNLPERCQERAQPVKEYIENHLEMLNNMMYQGSYPERNPKKIISRSDNYQKKEEALIQEQLESLGLGREHHFTPKFDLDKMIEKNSHEKLSTPSEYQANARQQNVNVNKRDLKSVSRSKKYNKLLDAVRKVKLKRDSERRIAEAFGKSSDYSGFNFNMMNNEARDIAKANFESPLVYSL